MFQPVFECFLPAFNHLLHIHPQLFEGFPDLLPFLVQTKHPVWENKAQDNIADCYLQGVFE